MRKEFIEFLIELPRPVKRGIMIFLDAALSVFAFWTALSLRFETVSVPNFPQSLTLAIATALLISFLAFTNQYNAIYRFLGLRSLLSLMTVVGIFSIAFAFIISLRVFPGIPKSIAILYPVLLLFFLISVRLLARFILGSAKNLLENRNNQHAFIYGAGAAGRQLAMALSITNEIKVAGYIDDDPKNWGNFVNGLKVYNSDDAIAAFDSLNITDLLLAIPSLNRERRRAIVDSFSQQKLRIRTLPGVSALATGRISAGDLTDIRVEDLLGRDPSLPDPKLISHCTTNKTVLVTGAGGSIGSEICKQVLATNPEQLIMTELNEYGLYQIEQDLKALQADGIGATVKLVPLIADIKNQKRMEAIFNSWSINTIYHAAAYKHVPLVELNVSTAIENNIFGTLNLVKLAEKQNVQNFVLISTDKAVRPTNFMGASKRVAEITLQSRARSIESKPENTTIFSMVRFGNVLNSSGSVVPLFKKQIKEGGPITLTHPDVTRYFMTIPEAAQLVIQAGSMGLGGDVFVLDMGESVRIYDLAIKMIDLSGKTLKDSNNPNGEIEVSISGLRPGEKKYEELLIGDNPVGTDHPRIWKAYEEYLEWDELEPFLEDLKTAALNNESLKIQRILKQLVSGYEPSSPIADLYQ